MDYFELFGLPFEFQLESKQLTTRYHELQRALHPDRLVTKTAHEQRLAIEQSSLVNQAYEVVSNPMTRAEYMIEQHIGASCGTQSIAEDNGFLMQQMTLRENLDLIASQRDMQKLSDFKQEIKLMYKDRMTQLETYLSDQDFSTARYKLNQIKFIDKLQDKIESLEQSLLEG